MNNLQQRLLFALFLCFTFSGTMASAQTINHQISLPAGMTWCDDGTINGLFSEINLFRTRNGAAALQPDSLGTKDAETRAVQFATYMATHYPGTPGFNPHEGYDTTAANLGYNLVSENLAYLSSDPLYIVNVIWQDPLHLAALLSGYANVAGVSCVNSEGAPYWTYEPGAGQGSTTPAPAPPPPSPSPVPTGGGNGAPSLDSEESSFLTLINNYRAQNGVAPLQLSTALVNSSKWMSNDMATNNYVSHTDSLGRDPGTRLQAFGYTYSPWGENIAAGYSDAQSVLDQLIGACDPDASGACTYAHRRNMLSASFAAIGIGRAYGANSSYRWYWTTDFGGVVDQAPQSSAPVIGSFGAAPSSVTPGQATTLSWNVSGASSVVIDNGVGDVSGLNSTIVSPSQTTSYKLTASNSSGTKTATVTVTVNAPAGDTQAPTAPSVSAVAKSASEVDLTWTASSDNVAVAGYQITRNGVVVGSVPATALLWADTQVTGGNSYSYAVQAYDAAGNYSAASNTAQVTTPAGTTPPVPSGPSSCSAPGANVFTACYYNGTDLTGAPVLMNTAPQISFDWSWGFPSAPVPQANFSVRWQGRFQFNQGTYAFNVLTADGVRVYVDGVKIIDQWNDQPGYSFSAQQSLSAGSHLVTVEYYDHTALPLVHLSWQQQ